MDPRNEDMCTRTSSSRRSTSVVTPTQSSQRHGLRLASDQLPNTDKFEMFKQFSLHLRNLQITYLQATIYNLQCENNHLRNSNESLLFTNRKLNRLLQQGLTPQELDHLAEKQGNVETILREIDRGERMLSELKYLTGYFPE